MNLKDFRNTKNLARGIRNNNPGNLVGVFKDKNGVLTDLIPWNGLESIKLNPTRSEKHFAVFTDVYYGLRAMMIDIRGDINRGQNTIRRLIEGSPEKGFSDGYAPKSDGNDSEAYIKAVVDYLGISENTKLDASNQKLIFGLMRKKINIESGNSAHLITDDYILKVLDSSDGWLSSLPFVDSEQKLTSLKVGFVLTGALLIGGLLFSGED